MVKETKVCCWSDGDEVVLVSAVRMQQNCKTRFAPRRTRQEQSSAAANGQNRSFERR
jgi:hypothetical protein